MTATDAADVASLYAGNGPDWNRRFIEGLARCGYKLMPWPNKQTRPPDTIDAPLPLRNQPGAWLGTHIIIRAP